MKRKKIFALAVSLVCILSSCGSESKETSLEIKDTNATTSTNVPKDINSSSDNSIGNEENNAETIAISETTVTDTIDEETDKDSYYDYEIIYDYDSIETLGAIVHEHKVYTKEETDDLVNKVLSIIQAIRNDDKNAAYEAMNIPYAIEKGHYDQTILSDETWEDIKNRSGMDYNFDCEMNNVTKVEFVSERIQGIMNDEIYGEVYIYLSDNEDYVIDLSIEDNVYFVGKIWLEKNLILSNGLKEANRNAKDAHNIVAEYAADMDTLGTPCTFNIEFDLSSNYDHKLFDKLKNYFDDYKISGVVFIGINNQNDFYVQWRSSYDSQIIGQYPNPIKFIYGEDVEWHTYFSLS